MKVGAEPFAIVFAIHVEAAGRGIVATSWPTPGWKDIANVDDVCVRVECSPADVHRVGVDEHGGFGRSDVVREAEEMPRFVGRDIEKIDVEALAFLGDAAHGLLAKGTLVARRARWLFATCRTAIDPTKMLFIKENVRIENLARVC